MRLGSRQRAVLLAMPGGESSPAELADIAAEEGLGQLEPWEVRDTLRSLARLELVTLRWIGPIVKARLTARGERRADFEAEVKA